jgi:hypothetical protein
MLGLQLFVWLATLAFIFSITYVPVSLGLAVVGLGLHAVLSQALGCGGFGKNSMVWMLSVNGDGFKAWLRSVLGGSDLLSLSIGDSVYWVLVGLAVSPTITAGYYLAWDVYQGSARAGDTYSFFVEALGSLEFSLPASLDFEILKIATVIETLGDITEYRDFDPGELTTASTSLAALQTIMSSLKSFIEFMNFLVEFFEGLKPMPTKPTAGAIQGGVLGGIWGEFWTDAQRDNKDFVLAAVECMGFALGHASERLRDDQEVVLAAVKQEAADPMDVFRDASMRLQEDAEVRRAAKIQPLAAPRGSRQIHPADTVIGARAVDVS